MEHPPGPEQPARTPAPSSTAPIGFRTAGDCRIPGSPPPAPRLPSHPDPAAEGQARLPLQLQVRPLRALPRTRAGHRGGPKSTERLQAQPEDARTRSPGWPGRGAGAAPSRKHHSPLRAANAGACPDSLSARWGWPSAPPCSRALGVPVRRVRSSRGKRGRSSSSGSGFQSSGAPACSTSSAPPASSPPPTGSSSSSFGPFPARGCATREKGRRFVRPEHAPGESSQSQLSVSARLPPVLHRGNVPRGTPLRKAPPAGRPVHAPAPDSLVPATVQHEGQAELQWGFAPSQRSSVALGRGPTGSITATSSMRRTRGPTRNA